MREMSPLRFGIIGLGYGGYQYDVLTSLNQQIILVMDKKEEKVKLPKYSSVPYRLTVFNEELGDIIEDRIDILLISLPVRFQLPFLEKYATKLEGKVVLLEKPVGKDIQDIKRMLEIASDNNIKVFVDHSFRFHPYVQTVRKFLEEKNSTPYMIDIFVGQIVGTLPENFHRWYHVKALGGGQIKMVLSHLLDLLLYLIPPAVKPEPCMFSRVISPLRADRDGIWKFVTAEEAFISVFRYENNILVSLRNTTYEHRGNIFKARFYFKEGILEIDSNVGVLWLQNTHKKYLLRLKEVGKYSVFSYSFPYLVKHILDYDYQGIATLNDAYWIAEIIY